MTTIAWICREISFQRLIGKWNWVSITATNRVFCLEVLINISPGSETSAPKQREQRRDAAVVAVTVMLIWLHPKLCDGTRAIITYKNEWAVVKHCVFHSRVSVWRKWRDRNTEKEIQRKTESQLKLLHWGQTPAQIPMRLKVWDLICYLVDFITVVQIKWISLTMSLFRELKGKSWKWQLHWCCREAITNNIF